MSTKKPQTLRTFYAKFANNAHVKLTKKAATAFSKALKKNPITEQSVTGFRLFKNKVSKTP